MAATKTRASRTGFTKPFNPNPHEVRRGQVWKDLTSPNDSTRYIEVREVFLEAKPPYAVVRNLKLQRDTKVKLSRFTWSMLGGLPTGYEKMFDYHHEWLQSALYRKAEKEWFGVTA